MSRVARGVVIVLACLLVVQPILPSVMAHSEGDSGHHDTDDEAVGRRQGSSQDNSFNPKAQRATPGSRYVHQDNPDAHGSLLVFEHRAFGRDWDIMALNVSSGGDAFPLTTRAVNERNPTVRGPWIAWEAHHEGPNATTDIVVFDIRTGHAIRVPDSGHDEHSPVIGARTVYYLVERGEDPNLRAFDLDTQTVEAPIGNRTVVGEPAAHGHQVAWATGSQREAKIHVLDRRTGNETDVPRLWWLKDGLTMGKHGLAFIAKVGGAQSGTYTWSWTAEGGLTPYRGNVYPQDNVDACDLGFVYGQPGTATSDRNAIVVQDGYINEGLTLTADNFDPACSDDHVIYVKEVEHPDEDIGTVRWVYHFPAENIRQDVSSKIRLDDGQERGIYSGQVRFSGTAIPGDPREPIRTVVAVVDNGEVREVDFQREDGKVRWETKVSTEGLANGQHRLRIGVIDDRGTRSTEDFVFYVDQPFELSKNQMDTGVNVPQTKSSPFPFSIIDHYQRYQPFYNTILLVLVLIAAAIWFLLRYIRGRPEGTPEYVPPDEP